MGRILVSGAANGAIYGLLALGIVLVYRGSKVLNFAQGEVGTLGVYVSWTFVEILHVPWLVAAALGITAAGLLGFLFERFVVRNMVEANRLSIAVATIGLMLLLISVEFKVWGGSPRVLDGPIPGKGPRVFGFHISPTYLVAFATVGLLAGGLAIFFKRSDFGLGVLAAAQDPAAVRLMGVPLARVSSFTWVSASAVGAIAALLIEPSLGSFYPGFTTRLFVIALAAALLGGLNSLPGAFLGGLLMGEIEQVMPSIIDATTFPGISLVSVFTVVILVLLFRPQGLLGKMAR